MERYIISRQDRITRTDTYLVRVDKPDGTSLVDLEPRRLFPLTDTAHYITLLDSSEQEAAMIRDMENDLSDESRQAVLDCFGDYYMIPEITGIMSVDDKFGLLKWHVQTDRGSIEFSIRNRHSDIKLLPNGSLLVRDSNDNRYTVPDIEKLDRQSLKKIFSYI